MGKIWFPPNIKRLYACLDDIAYRWEKTNEHGERIIVPLDETSYLVVRHPANSSYNYELCHMRELRPDTLPLVECIAQVDNEGVLAMLIRQVLTEGGKQPSAMRW